LEFALGDTPGGTSAPAPAPSGVTVLRGAGAGGSDRVVLSWPDNAVRNTWLRVTLKATAHTGLAAPDVFYFGNLAGDTGDAAGAGATLRVNAVDLAGVKKALNTASDLTGRYDFNRDGKVNALDLGAVKANLNRSLAPSTPPVAMAGALPGGAASIGPEVRRVWDEAPAAWL
jgi:hypothetical protein